MTTLLIVDDESWVRDAIKMLITQPSSPYNQWELKEAKNGVEAIEILQIDNPDIMITDMKMPGIDGRQLLEAIENKYSHIPTIVLSGYDDFVYTKQAIKSKVIDYLLKPVNEKELFQSLENAIKYTRKLEQNQLSYQLLTIDRPEIANLIQPFHRSIYFDFKEGNQAEFINKMQQFIESIEEPLREDPSFLFHLQQKFYLLVEEVMQEFRIHLDDLDIKDNQLTIDPEIPLERLFDKQLKIGQALISIIEKNKKQKNRIDLEEIKVYIDHHYDARDLSLDVVAKKFFVSKEYLTTVFKKKYSYNITEYIISLRMEKAKQLITATNMQFKTIAEKVGYEDVPYFYRVFRRYFHVSPGEMRNA